MGDYKKLDVWEEAMNLSFEIYNCTTKERFKNDFVLRDQIRRSALSVPSNIAEGEEIGSIKNCVRYFMIAKASLAELETQFIFSRKLNYIDDATYRKLSENIDKLSRKLKKLIIYRRSLIK